MLNTVLPVALVASNPLAVVCFGLGIAALLFVFRRTIFRAKHRTDPLAEMSTRFNTAHQQVEQIAEREQYRKLHAGYRFFRVNPGLSPQDCRLLASLPRPDAGGSRDG